MTAARELVLEVEKTYGSWDIEKIRRLAATLASVEDAQPDELELRGCPFCGAEPYLHEPAFRGDNYQIGCTCGRDVETGDEEGACWRDGATLEEVAERWNRRAESGKSSGNIEREG